MLIQSYQVLNELAKTDNSSLKNFYSDVNYAFCVIIFGQIIGIMCAKMFKLLSNKDQEKPIIPLEYQILIADVIYLIIIFILHHWFNALFGSDDEEETDHTHNIYAVTVLLLFGSTMTVLMLRMNMKISY